MAALGIIVSALAGAGLGFMGGFWYGTKVDTSDFPIYPVFTGPVGALIGGFVGVVIGAVILT